MARKHYDLPPLTTLSAFEAAARHLSFKDAAAELNVTPGAVSHQVKALEEELSVALFIRQHRGVSLTEQGATLFSALENSFTQLSATLSRIRAVPDRNFVTVAATTAVSSLWLTPRLTSFWRHHGDVAVNQHVYDTPLSPGRSVDLIIRYGDMDDEENATFPLFRDQLVPVCSPQFAEEHPVQDLKALAQMRLIHMEAQNDRWTTWQTWFRGLGYDGDVAQGQRVNNYSIALQAACDDIGVVLGWQKLVAPLIERNALVTLGTYALPAPHSFYILADAAPAVRQEVKLLRDWLLDSV